MRLKKPVRSSKPAKARAKGKRGKRFSMPAKNVWQAGAIAFGLLGVVAVAALFAARPQTASQDADNGAAPSASAAPPVVMTKAPAAARTAAPMPAVYATEDEAPSPGAISGGVTVTGCLERSDDGFRLNHTEGVAAPKSRSWKSGFLKKSSVSIDLTDPGNSMRLKDHVGERISVSGMLIDRDMRVQSLHRIAKVCE